MAEMDEHMIALYVNVQTGRIQTTERCFCWKHVEDVLGADALDESGLNRLHWDPPILGRQQGKLLMAGPKSRVPAYHRDPGPTGELQPGADGGRGMDSHGLGKYQGQRDKQKSPILQPTSVSVADLMNYMTHVPGSSLS